MLDLQFEFDAFAAQNYRLQKIPWTNNILACSTKEYAGKNVWMNPPYCNHQPLITCAKQRVQQHAKSITALVPEWLAPLFTDFVKIHTYPVGTPVFHKAGKPLLPSTFPVHVYHWKTTEPLKEISIQVTNMQEDKSFTRAITDSGSQVTILGTQHLPVRTNGFRF